MTAARTRLLRPWALWTVGFLAFPLAGIVGGALAGPVDDLLAAVLGGAVTGLVIGAGQSLVGRGAVPPLRWIPATALGMAAGLALGAGTVGYGTSLPDLALMGLLTGIPLGVAQALALPTATGHRRLWALTTPVLWALGWTVTTLVGSTSRRSTRSSARPGRSSSRRSPASCSSCPDEGTRDRVSGPGTA
ncbi:MAG: hypothetical protein OJJ54_21020 [Pseudonocardia sp.]|nr:hypothetical protein [Pseudonocardia sp.]